MAEKTHISIVTCGHVDSGKSTTAGNLIYSLGGINDRDMEKLRTRARELGKDSFAFAFYMDTQKEEQERGITIACTTKEFFTDNYHYTIVDAPGHRDYIRNMISGSSQVDVALILVPGDGTFASAVAKGDHKAGEVQGQTRQHARLINLLGVKQVVVGINKVDSAGYSAERFEEVRNEMQDMLTKVGYKKEYVMNNIPIIPYSGWTGDNLVSVSDKMPWWQGIEVTRLDGQKVKVVTVKDVLNNFVVPPPRNTDAPFRCPISGVYNIKGVGNVITGRVEQGKVNPGDEVVFLPTHSASTPCQAKVFSIEMHHKSIPQAGPGDNCGFSMKGLDKANMPRNGDVMVLAKDSTLKRCKSFVAQVQVLDHPGELKIGYSPVGCVRTAHSTCKMTKLNWKIGKETGGKKLENPVYIKTNEAAEVEFEPLQPFVVDKFTTCEGLGRIAFMDQNSCIMLGKIISVTFAEDVDKKAAGKKK